MQPHSLPAGSAIILASLLAGGAATSPQQTPPPPPQLQILQWSAPSPPGSDVYTAPLVFSKTRYATCGPYTLTTRITLDRKKLLRRPPRRGWQLVGLGGAGSIRLLRDQRLSVTRLFAHRTVPTPTFTTARSLAHRKADHHPAHLDRSASDRQCQRPTLARLPLPGNPGPGGVTRRPVPRPRASTVAQSPLTVTSSLTSCFRRRRRPGAARRGRDDSWSGA